MTEILTPTGGSRFVVVLTFLLPLLIVPVVGFGSWLRGGFSLLFVLIALQGVLLLIPGWHWMSREGEDLLVRAGPGAVIRVPVANLEPAGSWTFFFLPTLVDRPVLIWRDDQGVRREKPLFHVYGSGLEETRALLSGLSDTPALQSN